MQMSRITTQRSLLEHPAVTPLCAIVAALAAVAVVPPAYEQAHFARLTYVSPPTPTAQASTPSAPTELVSDAEWDAAKPAGITSESAPKKKRAPSADKWVSQGPGTASYDSGYTGSSYVAATTTSSYDYTAPTTSNYTYAAPSTYTNDYTAPTTSNYTYAAPSTYTNDYTAPTTSHSTYAEPNTSYSNYTYAPAPTAK